MNCKGQDSPFFFFLLFFFNPFCMVDNWQAMGKMLLYYYINQENEISSLFQSMLHYYNFFFFFYWRYKSHMEKILHTTWLILSHVSFSRPKKKLWDFTNFAHSHPISNVCIYLFNMFKLYIYIYIIYSIFIPKSLSLSLSLSLSYDYLSSFSFIFTSLVLKPPH